MAESTPSGGAATLDLARREEQEVSASLAACDAQMRANAEALWMRSTARTTLRDHSGALEDAERAAALCPDNSKFLIRATEALWACGHLQRASIAHERARLLLLDHHLEQYLRCSFVSMDKRLRPFHYLPEEVLAPVFEFVMLDWEQLPSPFQLSHVCSQWRRIVNSTPSLWRDTRILRVEVKLPLEDRSYLSPPVRKPYCFCSTSELPEDGKWHPRGRNHQALLQHCATKSRNTLTHFEFETRNAHPELVHEVLGIARASSATLTFVSIVNKDKDAEFAGQCFHLIMRCPALTSLALSVGKVSIESVEKLESGLEALPPMTASLRELKLDGLDCFGTSSDSSLDRLFLQRCCRLETATLIEDEARSYTPDLRELAPRLLRMCADSLVDLETSACAEIFHQSKEAGLETFSQLRRLRHVRTYHDWNGGSDFFVMNLPKLESLEGNMDVARYQDKVPARVALRYDRSYSLWCDEIASWLLNNDDDWGTFDLSDLSELIIEIAGVHRETNKIGAVIDALTPTVAGKVVCPRLSSFSLLFKDEYAEGYAEADPLDLSCPSMPPALYREQWEAQVDVSSRLLRMEAERRRLSRHRPLDKKQRKLTDFSAAFTRESHARLEAKARAPCAALHTITLEGCHVDEAAWGEMKQSACDFKVSPDPQEMAKLPYEEEPKKKKKVRFEEEPKGEQKEEKKRKSPWGHHLAVTVAGVRALFTHVVQSDATSSPARCVEMSVKIDFATNASSSSRIINSVMAAGGAPQRDVAGLDDEEFQLCQRLATSAAQLEAHAQALLRRSEVRSANGNHVGALEDAESAVALFPKQAEYLVRAAEAFWSCGRISQASEAYDRARAALGVKGVADEGLCTALDAMDQRLRPLHYMPNEILASIFEHVYNDWERLPSPFQVCHVSRRWREIAFGTPALWRDTRILRVQTKVPVEHRGLSGMLRKPYCFLSEDRAPRERWGHPRDRNNIELLQHCARKSHNTLSHLEIYTLNSHPELMDELFNVATASAATLTSFSIVNHDEAWDITHEIFRLVFQCPRLADLSMSVGGLGEDSCKVLDALADQTFESMPASLRRLRLDGVDCFGESSASFLRQIFLERCVRLESLTLLRHTLGWDDSLPHSSTFGEELLAVCAGTLLELETDRPFSLFDRAHINGVSTLPQLRRFRRVTPKRSDEGSDLLEIELPKLDIIEAGLGTLQAIRAPSRVVVRHDILNSFGDDELASWLRDEDGQYHTENVQELTIEIVLDNWTLFMPELQETINALTPSIAGKVVCPHLKAFSILIRDEQADGAAETSPFDFVSLLQGKPTYREDWEEMIDASRLVRMEEERRRISLGSFVEEDQHNTIVAPALDHGSPPSKKAKLMEGTQENTASEVESAASPRCAALDRITLEGCYVDDAAWAAIKTSQCQYSVLPDPEGMKLLAYGGLDRKRNQRGERKMRADEDQ